jgi:hypothetical protein
MYVVEQGDSITTLNNTSLTIVIMIYFEYIFLLLKLFYLTVDKKNHK